MPGMRPVARIGWSRGAIPCSRLAGAIQARTNGTPDEQDKARCPRMDRRGWSGTSGLLSAHAVTSMGAQGFLPLCDAPGTYVLEG
jgi:hypothetical protein